VMIFRIIDQGCIEPLRPTPHVRLASVRSARREPQDQAFVGIEHEILQVDGAMLSSGMSGQLQESRAGGIGQPTPKYATIRALSQSIGGWKRVQAANLEVTNRCWTFRPCSRPARS
jgi:hypothetical protein